MLYKLILKTEFSFLGMVLIVENALKEIFLSTNIELIL